MKIILPRGTLNPAFETSSDIKAGSSNITNCLGMQTWPTTIHSKQTALIHSINGHTHTTYISRRNTQNFWGEWRSCKVSRIVK